MRKIGDVLRLHAGGLSKRRIAVSLNIGRTAVGDYISRARRAGLGWPLREDLSEEGLERLLFAPPTMVSPNRRPLPDWPLLHRELKRPGVTLSLLWEEYRAVHPMGYGYSRFCELYRAWKGKLDLTMRQTHLAGEKMFVDYAGATMEVFDGLTGEIRTAQVFVATLSASSYTYAEATWTQALPDWIGSHTRAFAYFGGAPRQVVPDNLKSGVVKACLYDTSSFGLLPQPTFWTEVRRLDGDSGSSDGSSLQISTSCATGLNRRDAGDIGSPSRE